MALACGLCAGGNYFNQPLLHSIAEHFSVAESAAAASVTLAQVAYASGLLLLAPLGDKLQRRGLAVGLGVLVVTLAFVRPGMVAPLWVLVFAVCGAGLLGTLGLIAGLWAEKFDQMAAFQNFLIMPMTFLSGVFYSISSLPPFWQTVSHLNPFFYMIDGFRYGFFGVSDVSPWVSISLVAAAWLVVSGLALHLLRIGYKIRN